MLIKNKNESWPPKEGDKIKATDYYKKCNWSYITENPSMPVDVFLLYPTTYKGDAPLACIKDTVMRDGADKWREVSGSAFETAGNIFMPYYRQLNAMWALDLPSKDQKAYQRGAPKTDALAAFGYYLEHFNGGRPFILASHSQGSTMAKEILFDYLRGKPKIARRMIAAYVIGYSVTWWDFLRNPRMRFAKGANDTGVIISYNTVAPCADPDTNSVLLPSSMAINPISWTRTGKPSPPCSGHGSFVDTGEGYERVARLADATVAVMRGKCCKKYGVVVCSTADLATYGMPAETHAAFGDASFHGNDIQFYYFNLRENAENRVRRFLKG